LTYAGIESFQINTGPFGGDCHLEAGWINNVLSINPEMEIMIISGKTGEGMQDWVEFLENNKQDRTQI
jgi:hypothetical protein